MDWMPSIFRRRKIYDDVSEEMRLHVEERTEQLMREGMSRGEAEQAAHRAFGNRTLLEERSREVWQWSTVESIWGDVRFALRQLRRSPGFTFAAVFTLALAIGANAVVFAVLDGLVLRPLNVPQARSLYGIERAWDKEPSQSYPDYLDLRDRNHSFDDLAAYRVTQVALDTGENPSLVWGVEASGNYFDALQIHPYLGRFFHGTDEHGANSAPYIVLSYAYWHSRFQDNRGVVDRTVLINKHPFTVIGVAPPGFRGTLLFLSPELFIPLVNREEVDGDNDLKARGSRWLFMAIGHLKRGVSPTSAIADLNSIGSYLEKTYPKDDVKMTFTLARPGLLGDQLGGPVRAFLAGLMLLAGLILLAACANLGSLFAARAADRSREIALRLALGSSRKRVLRGLLTEAVLISLAGGAAGLCCSVLLLRGLSVWQPFPRNFPVHMPFNPDARLYGVALVLSLASGLLFGAVPVREVLRTNPYEVVKSGSSFKLGRRLSIRDVLLCVQIAICAVLITSSLVAVRGLVRALHSTFGFDPQNAIVVSTDLQMTGYIGDRVPLMQRRVLDALATIPGVESLGFADTLLLDGAGDSFVFTDNSTDLRQSNAAADASTYRVSPGYLQAEGTVLLSGRTFTWQDDKNSTRIALVNREFARRVFGSVTKAIGSRFKMPDGTRVQVVGITEDGKHNSLTEDPQPAMFLPILQSPSTSTQLVVRSKSDPQELESAIRRTMHKLDPGLPVYIDTRYRQLDAVLIGPRIATIALGVLGMMGAMLSITGIFGMAAYSVSKRLKELGIRMALGAQRKQVLQTALGRAFRLLAIGSTTGLLFGLLATRVLAYIVYQATPRDPLVLAGVVLAMAVLGLAATWIPAQRALSVNPIILLRED